MRSADASRPRYAIASHNLHRYLTETGAAVENYEPLADPELYLRFAEIDSDELLLKFANTQGWLLEPTDLDGAWCEPLSTWHFQINKCRAVLDTLELLDAWASNDEGNDRGAAMRALAGRIRWSTVGAETDGRPGNLEKTPREKARRLAVYEYQGFKQFIRPLTPGVQFIPGDVVEPARAFVAQVINWELRGRASIAIHAGANGALEQRIAPSNLLGAIWLQAFQQATKRTRVRRCDICRKRMDITEHRRNKTVHTSCSLRRRMAKYRERK